MEKRKAKISIGKVGGNASRNALKYKINIPTAWAQGLKIDLENRDVEMQFDGEKITIKKL